MLSFEKARIENTYTWLATLPSERTNQKGTLFTLNAGKTSIKGWSTTLSAGLELSITLPIPAKHSLTYLNKAAEEILQESKPPVLLDDTYFQSYLKKDVSLRNPITGT